MTDSIGDTRIVMGDHRAITHLTERIEFLAAKLDDLERSIGRASPVPMHPVSPDLRVRMFGALRVDFRGTPIEGWGSRRSRLLVTFLAERHPRPTHRDELLEHMWPGADPRAARGNLHQAVHGLRRMFREAGAPDPIQLVGDCYRLNAEWSVWTDTREFEVLARRALSGAESNDEMRIETIGKAIELYSGDYLDTDPYESWTEDLRRHRRRLHTDLLELQSRLLLNTGRLTEAISACRTILRVEPTNESGHRRLMVALMRQGRSTDALDAYEHCRSTLGDELGMTPSPETERAYECILRNESL